MQRGLRVITLQGAIEKSPILLSQYWKFEWSDGTIIISYFGCSNNIFADSRIRKNSKNFSSIHHCSRISVGTSLNHNKRDFTIEKQPLIASLPLYWLKSFNFIMICWDSWIKIRVNKLSCRRVRGFERNLLWPLFLYCKISFNIIKTRTTVVHKSRVQ